MKFVLYLTQKQVVKVQKKKLNAMFDIGCLSQ